MAAFAATAYMMGLLVESSSGSDEISEEEPEYSPPKKRIFLKKTKDLIKSQVDRSKCQKDVDAKARRSEDPFTTMNDEQFQKTYGFEKSLAKLVIMHVRPQLSKIRAASDLWIMMALHQFVHGCKRPETARIFGVSKTTVFRARQAVTDVLVELAKKHIKFPSSPEELKSAAKVFENVYKMPEVVGVLYCTQIAVEKTHTSDKPTAYLNPFGYTSLNVQLVSNESNRIVSCLSKYPGSTEDYEIWQSSQIHEFFSKMYSKGNSNYKLVGAGGYLAEPWLLTPVGDAEEDTPAAKYNAAHKAASQSSVITLAILKGRFGCLTKPNGFTMRPINAARAVIACAVIHNLALETDAFQIPWPAMKIDECDSQKLLPLILETDDEDMILDEVGRSAKEKYIEKYFS